MGELDQTEDGWFKSTWRPAMAWQYFVVCLCDFILFPASNAALYAAWDVPYKEWHPLTLQGGGLYHISMGAIVGVATYARSQEKMATLSSVSGSVVERTVERSVKTEPRQPQSGRAD